MNRYTTIIIAHALALPTFILALGLFVTALGIPFAPVLLASYYGFIGIAYFGLYLLLWIICIIIIMCLICWYDHTVDINIAMSAAIQLIVYATIIAAMGA